MRGATRHKRRQNRGRRRYFNPRSSCEERRRARFFHALYGQFQSTLLMRGATAKTSEDNASTSFQSTLLMRGATKYPGVKALVKTFQSTLLMRGATMGRTTPPDRNVQFQSTLLMRGATRPTRPTTPSCSRFQSTLLMRGATAVPVAPRHDRLFQSTLLMRGATTDYTTPAKRDRISIHAPHARSDKNES